MAGGRKRNDFVEALTSRNLSKLQETGTYALPSQRRTTFLLALKKSDGQISRESRENEVILSLKTPKTATASIFQLLPVFGFNLRKMTLCNLLSYLLKISKISILSLFVTI